MYPILALLWAGAALGLFLYEWQTGDERWRLFDGRVPGWGVLLLFAGYNVARWLSARAVRAEREAMRIAQEARLRQARRSEAPAEPDPTFDFTDRKGTGRNDER